MRTYDPPPPIVTREENAPRRPSSGWLGIPVAIAALAGVWIAMGSGREAFLVPPPAAVLAALETMLRDPAFTRAATATLTEAGLGFLAALVAAAVVSAVFSGPLRMGTVVLMGVPAAALLPVAVVWLGIGMGASIAGAALLAFGPMVVGFAADGAARRPAATVGAAMALNGALVAEFVASAEGLGFLLMERMAQLDVAKLYAAALILAAIGVLAVLVVHALLAVFVRDDR